MRKILFVLFMLFILLMFASFGSAFSYNGTECDSDSNPAYIVYDDVGKTSQSGAGTIYDFDDITDDAGEEFIIYVEGYGADPLSSGASVVYLRRDDDEWISAWLYASAEWKYLQGSSTIGTGLTIIASKIHNFSLFVEYTGHTTTYNLWDDNDLENNWPDNAHKNNDPLAEFYVAPDGGTANWTGVYMWNQTMIGSDPCPLGEDTTPPTNSTWEVTSGNVPAGQSTTIWDTKGVVNISNDTLSFTFTASEDSNWSCILEQNLNYSDTIALDSNYKLATTETTSHSYTVYDDFSEGNYCLYCSGIDLAGNGGDNSSSGCLNFSRWSTPNLETPTDQSVTSGTQEKYNLSCIANGTTTWSSNISDYYPLNLTSNFTFGNFTFEPFFSTIGLYNVSVNCSSIYGDNISSFLLTVSATAAAAAAAAVEHESIEISLPSGRRIIR